MAEKTVAEHLAAGEKFLVHASNQFMMFNFVLAIPADYTDYQNKRVVNARTIRFVAGQYVTDKEDEIAPLMAEVKSHDCPNLVSCEWVTVEQLNPLYAVKQQAIAEYLASVNKAAATNIGDTVADSGMVTTSNSAVKADPQAALKAALADAGALVEATKNSAKKVI